MSANDDKTFGIFPVASFVGSGVISNVEGFTFLNLIINPLLLSAALIRCELAFFLSPQETEPSNDDFWWHDFLLNLIIKIDGEVGAGGSEVETVLVLLSVIG